MKYVMILVFAMYIAPASAQTIKEVWSDMPDSIMPLLSRNNRLDCVDYWEAGQYGDVKNRLEGKVVILFMNEDSLAVADTEVSSYEMRLERGAIGDVRKIFVRHNVKVGGIMDWTERVFSPAWQLLKEYAAPRDSFEDSLMKGARFF